MLKGLITTLVSADYAKRVLLKLQRIMNRKCHIFSKVSLAKCKLLIKLKFLRKNRPRGTLMRSFIIKC